MNHRFHVFAHEDASNTPEGETPIEVACDASLDEGAIIRTVAPHDSIAGSRTQYFLGLTPYEGRVLLGWEKGDPETAECVRTRVARLLVHAAEDAKVAAEPEPYSKDGVVAGIEEHADLAAGLRTLMTVAAIRRAKIEVLTDIAEGRVPYDVGSFMELHDHVDANEYGGLCDTYAFTLEEEDPCEFANAVQGAVDEWLKAGRPIPTARVQVAFKLEAN